MTSRSSNLVQSVTEAMPDIPEVGESAIGSRFREIWNEIVTWIDANTVELMVGAFIALVMVGVLIGVRRFGRAIYRADPSLSSMRSVVGRTLAKTRTWFMVILAVEIVLAVSQAPTAIARPFQFLFFIALVVQAAIWARSVILGFIEHRTNVDEDINESLDSAMKLIRISVTLGVAAVAAIVVLDNLNVDVTGLIAGLGIGGIAIGLAAQGVFAELFAALAIIFDKPFVKGDSIHYDGTYGTVEQIGLKSTRLRSVSGEEIIISNSKLLDKELFNLTRLDRRRIYFTVGVIYQTDPEKAARIPDILKSIIEEAGHNFIRAGFTGFGDSSLDYELQFDVLSADYEVVFMARHAMGVAIFKRFAEEGLEFAYPTQTTFTAAPDGKMILPYPEGGWGGSND